MTIDLNFSKPVPADVKLIVNHGWELPGHAGVDIALREGTPLLAVDDGVVLRAIRSADNRAGIHVDMQTKLGVVARYLHMSNIVVNAGQAVSRGQLLGQSGNTGLSIGPHLHFETRPPKEMLAEIFETTGFRESNDNFPSYLPAAVPTEPWLPVDGYSSHVIALDKQVGIPLYHEIKHDGPGGSLKPLLWGAALFGVGYWIYRSYLRGA